MKFKNLLIATFMLGSMYMSGQTFTPINATIEYDKALRPCLEVNLDPDTKTLKAAWADYLKENHDFKIGGIGILSNKDLLSIEKVVINKISTKALNFYTQIVEGEGVGSQMKVFAAFGYDMYIDAKEYPKEYAALKEIFEGFINTYIPAYYTEIIEGTQSDIKDFTKKDENLNKGIQKAKESIVDMQEKIKEKQQLIITNEAEIKKFSQQLEASKKVLEATKKRLSSM